MRRDDLAALSRDGIAAELLAIAEWLHVEARRPGPATPARLFALGLAAGAVMRVRDDWRAETDQAAPRPDPAEKD